MPSSVKDPKGEKPVEDALQFPDRAAFDTVAEYDATVKKYWKAMDRYRDLASKLHEQLLKGCNPRPVQNKEEHDLE
jgi:hypothetical protein